MNDRLAIPRIDAWTASSLLQKAIRRGENDYAISAALALFRMRGSAIWRRLMLICFEDIGVGDVELCATVSEICTSLEKRRVIGSDYEAIVSLVAQMCGAVKNREADYLICTAKQSPFTERDRAALAGLPLRDLVTVSQNDNHPIVYRAIATWICSGINGGGPKALARGDLDSLMRAFSDAGFPPHLGHAVHVGCAKTAEPIVIMLPLLWSAIRAPSANSQVFDELMPPAVICGGLPSWVFDKHTRIGKSAVAQLLKVNTNLRNCLAEYVPEFRAMDVACMAAFYTDAICTSRRLVWSQSGQLYDVGLETDMSKVGADRSGVSQILEVMRSSLDELNDIRRQLRNLRNRDGHDV